MSDPVGGRGAEREVVARVMYEQGMGFDIDADPVARESMLTVAESILVALDALRSSGSAAQNHWRDLYWETLAEVERLRSSGSAAQRCGRMPHLRGGCALELGHDGDHFFPNVIDADEI